MRISDRSHLYWISWFQLLLLPLGAAAWLLRSPVASMAFGVGGLCSLAFWSLHCFFVKKMLTPSIKLRWFFGMLGLLKIGLIIAVLRGMMSCFPQEMLALVTGIMLFAASIMLEAIRLMIWPDSSEVKTGPG